MFRNTAGQKLTVYAVDSTTGLPKPSDAANITAYVSKDDGALAELASSASGPPSEVSATNAPGYYKFALTQAETNADKLLFSAKSSTSGIVVYARPDVAYTTSPGGIKNVGYLGDFAASATDCRFTFSAFDGSGAPADIADFAVTCYRISDGTTQTGINISQLIGVTGFYDIPIDITTSSFFRAGEDYMIYASAGTIDGTPVAGSFICHFSIANRIGAAGTIDASGVWSYNDRSLTSGMVRVTNPWQQGTLNILKGATASASRYVITKSSDWDWPSNLTTGGFTITLTATPTAATLEDEPNAPDFTNTGNIIDATSVNLGAMTAANTDTLVKPKGNGANAYTYRVTASKTGELWVLETGVLSVG